MTQQERADTMVLAYGETVKITHAARILNMDRSTIYKMLHDGRLDPACAGTMVDVRSIARYICQPAVENRKARMRKQGLDTRWAV